ncbi:MAG: hypothetical protein R3E95_11705 [Thiolinea sp.]
MPGPEDFHNALGGLPHVEELLHYPVLDGLGLLNREVARAVMARDPKFRAFARESVDYLTRQGRELAAQALPHRQWLAALHQEV